MSCERETEAEAFRNWFASQTTYNSLFAMERALNITKYYLHLIKNGSRRAADPELRRKLREATGLKAFDPISDVPKIAVHIVANHSDLHKKTHPHGNLQNLTEPTIKKSSTNAKILEQPIDTLLLIKEVKQLREKVDQIDTKLTEANVYQEIAKKPSSNNVEERAKTVMRLLMSLSSELDFFKNCTENERKIFKGIVPGQDVGYITTLLRALYDEDKFQRWLLFSTYTMKGKENGD